MCWIKNIWKYKMISIMGCYRESGKRYSSCNLMEKEDQAYMFITGSVYQMTNM